MHLSSFPACALLLASAFALPAGAESSAVSPPTAERRVYSHLLEPRDHPDYERRAVRPPGWDTFKHRTQFTCLRGFQVEGDRIVGHVEELERFTRTHALGDVIWPSYPILFATNLGDLADEIARRDLYLFDVWGYVPGSGPGGYWQQFRPPREAFATLEAKLGDRWLGTDIGEQDGRYLGGYANQMTPASANRRAQHLNFQRHFERMGDDLGHRHATLVSLNFGHYFLKEGTYTLIGAETAQALPNSQVYYAFIRGAGKQYGVPWFGNASVYNRWGFKAYGSSGKSDGYEFGPTKGSSLSLLKRLLYSHILYNCVAVGYENMWFDGDQLSPLGRVQQAAQRWVKEHEPPGVQHTPVALLLDFHCGWSFPRHLYTDKLFRVWGNLPYEEGDHFTDAVLDFLYPGYADASYFHDETGFLTATPYGDIADCLLSDAPLWVLERYPVIVVGGTLTPGRELAAKLTAYVSSGGHLVFAEATVAGLSGFEAPGDASATATGVIEWTLGQGRITQLDPGHGLDADPSGAALTSEIDRPLPRPFTLTAAAREGLDRVLRSQMLFEVDRRLQWVTCRQGPGRYTVGVFNNGWQALPLALRSHCGEIVSVRELALDESEKTAIGYTPEGVAVAGLGRSTGEVIAGGDVRVFAVQVREGNVREIPHVRPAARPQGRFLPLRQPGVSIKAELLARPTFFEHFDGVILDWRYVYEREAAVLAAEAGWLKRQGLRLAVDLSSGINLYPDLRLIDNLPADYEVSTNALARLLDKMVILGAKDLLFTLHRHPENNFTGEQTEAAFAATLRGLAEQAAVRGVMLHLRLVYGKPPWGLAEGLRWIERVGAANLKLAPSTALLVGHTASPEWGSRLAGRIGFWCVAGPRHDRAGQLWDAHAPVAGSPDGERIGGWLRLVAGVPVALDGLLEGVDAEYLESVAVQRLLTNTP